MCTRLAKTNQLVQQSHAHHWVRGMLFLSACFALQYMDALNFMHISFQMLSVVLITIRNRIVASDTKLNLIENHSFVYGCMFLLNHLSKWKSMHEKSSNHHHQQQQQQRQQQEMKIMKKSDIHILVQVKLFCHVQFNSILC